MPNSPLIIRAASLVQGLTLFVDGYPNHVHKITTRIGGEPLEDGRDVTDHVVAAPEDVVLTGSVSDMVGGQRAKRAWQAIEELHAKSEPVRVITEWGIYPEMVIARCEAQPAGRGMTFELTVREILRVSAATGPSVPPTAQSGNAAGRSGQVARGRQQLSPAASIGAILPGGRGGGSTARAGSVSGSIIV